MLTICTVIVYVKSPDKKRLILRKAHREKEKNEEIKLKNPSNH